MERWVGKVAVVTGASAGIGASIVEILLAHGLKVIGLARRADRVKELAKAAKNGGELFAMQCDVSNIESIESTFQEIEKIHGKVDIHINNAGVFYETSYMSVKNEEVKNLFDVNVVGLIIASREALKIMEKKKIDGQIIHINSIAGHVISPNNGFTMYGATKHAVRVLTHGMRTEMAQKKLNIRISSICPGLVETEIFNQGNIHSVTPGELFGSRPYLKSEDIAQGVISILSTPQNVNVFDMIIKPTGEPY